MEALFAGLDEARLDANGELEVIEINEAKVAEGAPPTLAVIILGASDSQASEALAPTDR